MVDKTMMERAAAIGAINGLATTGVMFSEGVSKMSEEAFFQVLHQTSFNMAWDTPESELALRYEMALGFCESISAVLLQYGNLPEMLEDVWQKVSFVSQTGRPL